MSTILTPTSVFPGLLTPAANPQPIEAEPAAAEAEAADVDADAPEADTGVPGAAGDGAPETPEPADAVVDDAVAVARATLAKAVDDADAAMGTLAHDAATGLIEVVKAEIAAFMPELIAQVVAAVKPKRGRPPGSKNRPKLEAAAPARKGGRKAKAGGRKAKRKAR